jgi:hypothetical protein
MEKRIGTVTHYSAGLGAEVALKVDGYVREGDAVYKLTE